MFLDRADWHIQSGGNRNARTLHSSDTCCFQHRSLIRIEPLNLFFNQLPKVCWNSFFDIRQLNAQIPDSLFFDDHLLINQIFHQVNHEERIAFGPLVNRPS